MARRKKKQSGEKHKYDFSDIVFSPGWRTEDYRLADKQRQIERDSKKDEDSLKFGALLQLIKDTETRSLSRFTDLVFTQYPQLSGSLLQFYPNLDRYIRSLAADKLNEDISKSYQQYKELEEKYQEKFEEYQSEMHDKIAFKESQIADLEWFISRLIVPPDLQRELDDIKNEWNDFASVPDSQIFEFEKIL